MVRPRATVRRAGFSAWAGVLAACLGAIAVLAAGPAFAKPAKHVGSCDAHRKHATMATGKVIVYPKIGGLDEFAGTVTTYYACLRPAGKPVVVGHSSTSGGELPGNETVSDLHIAGTFVADSSASGFASAAGCEKDGDSSTNCALAVTYSVEVVDAKTHRRLRLRIPAGEGATAVAVSSAPAVAWLQTTGPSASVLRATVVHRGGPGQLTGTPQTLDTGAIGRALRWHGLTLRWTNAGQAKSQTLS